MQVSEARREANRRNAARSTGPNTIEGKLASRGNALKHGMTGSGAVMIEGDAAEVARRSEALVAELMPSGELGLALVRRVALHSVRMERCAIHEAAALSSKIRAAFDDFDDLRAAEVEAAFAALATDPPAALRRLRRMPEGVDRLIATWLGLADDLRAAGIPSGLRTPGTAAWSDARGRMVDHLMGRSPFEVSASAAAGMSRAILQADPGSAFAATHRERLIDLIDREVAGLRDHRATLDLQALQQERAEAPDRALFDPSKEATLARRYEAAAERGMYRALRELREVEADTPDISPAPVQSASGLRPSLASISGEPAPPAPPAPAHPEARPPVAASTPREPRPAAEHEFLDFAIGRPTQAAVGQAAVGRSTGARPRS